MRLKHMIIALAGGLSVYLGLSLLFGPTGINRYSARVEYYNNIIENIEDLEQREQQLSTELEALRTSTDRIRLHARTLGYYRRDERRIVIHQAPGLHQPPSPGRLVLRSFENDDPRPPLRFAAVILTGGIIALLVALDGRQDSSKSTRKSEEKTKKKPLYSERVQTASRE